MPLILGERLLGIGAWLGSLYCGGCAAVLIAARLTSQVTISRAAWWTAILSLLASLITFLLFAWDKRAAQKETRRIPEKWLHAATLLGGWSGAFLAQKKLRHKSQHASFQFSAWVGMALTIALWAILPRLFS